MSTPCPGSLVKLAPALLLSFVLAACGGDRLESPSAERVGTAQSQAVNFEPTPDEDPFYQPTAMTSTAPGTILKSRPIRFTPSGAPLPNPAWQLQYVTRDVRGNPTVAVATVVKPLVPSSTGRSVLVSFQHAYDSLGSQCNPSKTATGSTANQTNSAETLEYVSGLLALGWTVVIPDYEGTRQAWGANRLQGQAVLDGIRATLQFSDAGLDRDTPVALWGYSGGAWASSWAASLHPQYAPELKLTGTVAGGTPVEFLKIMKAKDGQPQFNFLFSAIIGMAREYPELVNPSSLTSKGLAAASALRDACVGTPQNGQTLETASLADYWAVSDPYNDPALGALERETSLLFQAPVPKTDIYVYHEINDELVPVDGADQLVASWCKRGVVLSYYRNSLPAQLNNPAIGIHLAGAAAGTPAAIAYLQSRLAGLPPLTPIGSTRCN